MEWHTWNWPTNKKVDNYDHCGSCACVPCTYSFRVGNYYVHRESAKSASEIFDRKHRFCVTSPNHSCSFLVTLPLILLCPVLAIILQFFTISNPAVLWPVVAVTILHQILTLYFFLHTRFGDPGILPVPEDFMWRSQNTIGDFKKLSRRMPRYPISGHRFVASHGV